ncbi:hypothetical protein G3I60_30415 [Streptomyces sp. SID13666]|uniref:hypothetical protein n=1 Tax=unclassified Streptomyces TaxID=2593676 RepID=UPI0013C2429D|nr:MULTISPECIES: hypothetical protein [unclassified Streptomyces]NEA58348.1 hypothetical protein [Streptomyces sp. SID13666]NEA69173.1 hypothetical protein [Streptomyces sp. SID13588]
MPPGVFTRAVGIRAAVVASAHLKANKLDLGLDMGDRAVNILGRVRSTRAHDYLRALNRELQPWSKEPKVSSFLHRSAASSTAPNRSSPPPDGTELSCGGAARLPA